MLGFWYKLVTSDRLTFSAVMYKFMFELQASDETFTFRWIDAIRDYLYELELSYLWIGQENLGLSRGQFKQRVKERLEVRFNIWYEKEMQCNRKCSFYKQITCNSEFSIQPFLKFLVKSMIRLARFRARSNKLPLTMHLRRGGEFANAPICMECDLDETCDEFHLLLRCTRFSAERARLPFRLDDLNPIPCIRTAFNSSRVGWLRALAGFVGVIMEFYRQR